MSVNCVLIVAAGRGRRFGGELPKQYMPLGGACVLRHTVQAFLTHPDVDHVRCVIHPDDTDLYQQAMGGLDLLAPVHGGQARQDSVRMGLESLAGFQPDTVLIHDGARPFASQQVIDGVLSALQVHTAALPAIAVADTLKRAETGVVTATVARDGVFRAQTPQGFRFQSIHQAHMKHQGQDFSDDTQLMELEGHSVHLTAGDDANFKITTSEDLMRAEQLLQSGSETRSAQGFDVHRFTPPGEKDHVVLCGVKIPHKAGLAGHSDADVALHALTDALLGAIGAGDIGQHFPPSDDTWKGADSAQFVHHSVALIHELGASIVNVDITIICETPKIGPHRSSMLARVSDLLGLDQTRVSIKATTTEGLGFCGRKEGIAAQALVNVRFPLSRVANTVCKGLA